MHPSLPLCARKERKVVRRPRMRQQKRKRLGGRRSRMREGGGLVDNFLYPSLQSMQMEEEEVERIGWSGWVGQMVCWLVELVG